MLINDESVEDMPHQQIVQKLRQLNEEADVINLTVSREVHCSEPEVYTKISVSFRGGGGGGEALGFPPPPPLKY